MSCDSDEDCMLTLQVTGEDEPMCLELNNPDMMSCQAKQCVVGDFLIPQSSDPKSQDFHATMLGFPGLSHAYVEFDRQNSRVGFAERSDKACKPECAAYLSVDTCQIADGCAWNSEK